jgi:alkylation response protein AidB-like acyl-CoA dehydrogenase
MPFTWGFMTSMVLTLREKWIYGGTSEIMKTIIARDITGLRT